MLGDIVGRHLEAVAVEDVLRYLAAVAEHDRYQASLGLDAAATLVAELAGGVGLSDVEIRRWPADGEPRWWSWRAPVAWTPLAARLAVRSPRGEVVVDHARQPFAVATYSAATPPGGVVAPLVPLGPALRSGDVALVDDDEFRSADTVASLVAAGAAGFVTAAPSRADGGAARSGRIELDPRSTLFAFSVTPEQYAAMAAAAALGATADALVDVDRSAAMPVVTAVLPGEEDGDEVWLTAHLCHPRPGANDNASGVAALLGAAGALASAGVRRRRAVRFVWGPEFLGTVAALHDATAGGRLPAAVVDLDMVGEDQARCGSPFVVEHPFDEPAGPVGPLAEAVVAEVFSRTARHPGTWTASPFVGFSDHAVFADPSVARPGVQLCHVGDRFNHSAADTLDKVSPVEMLRSTAAAAALAEVLAGDALPRAELVRVVEAWQERALTTAATVADRYAVAHPEWAARHLAHVAARTGAALAVARGADVAPLAEPPADEGAPLRRRWAGPVNVRALLADLPAARRREVQQLIADDKRVYSLLLNAALRVDGQRTAERIALDASLAAGRPIAPHVAAALTAALVESGWAEAGPPPSGELIA